MSFCCGGQDEFAKWLEEQLMAERKVLLKYVGSQKDGGEIAATGQRFEYHGTVEVTTSLAKDLVDGGDFERVEDEAEAKSEPAKAAPQKKGDG